MNSVNRSNSPSSIISSAGGTKIVLFEGKKLSQAECDCIKNTLKLNYEEIIKKNEVILEKNQIIKDGNVKLMDLGKEYNNEKHRVYIRGDLIHVMNNHITSTKKTLLESIKKLSQQELLVETGANMNYTLLCQAKQMLLDQLDMLECHFLNENPSHGEVMYYNLQQSGGRWVKETGLESKDIMPDSNNERNNLE